MSTLGIPACVEYQPPITFYWGFLPALSPIDVSVRSRPSAQRLEFATSPDGDSGSWFVVPPGLVSPLHDLLPVPMRVKAKILAFLQNTPQGTTRRKEFYFDYEIEKASKRLRKEAKATMRALNSTTFTEELDTLFDLSGLFAEEGPSLINMAKEKTLKELAPLELKSGLSHLLTKFKGLTNEDPYNHLKEFHVVYSSMKPDRITEEHIKLRAFPFSLEDVAQKWLFNIPTGSITSWDQMMKTFLERYFLASRVNNVRRNICLIKQHTNEILFDYWERLKELCVSCP
ncbi:DNA-directed DNA polymerase [Senna tora]|uniref:DNA-directed DNA polymerase n=1 Tax=Senna tora TaxID=362788 RepID=A0A834XIM5_9FABA|nr:DNA-directed DNA polymerase [Senna tora]